jgi:glycosyltransferase involved in cell wall biosynthesis
MKIGYLHIGPHHHGIYRYGRMLASTLQQRLEVVVLEVAVILTDDLERNRELLIDAAQKLAEADLIHFQSSYFNDQLWGKGWKQIEHLQIFLNHCTCPIVVTLHDVYYTQTGLQGMRVELLPTLFGTKKDDLEHYYKPSLSVDFLRQSVRAVKGWWANNFGPPPEALKAVASRASLFLVCSQEEGQRLSRRIKPDRIKIVPHFVESRSTQINSSEARLALNLVGKKVITILGFVFPAKGYQLLVEAIPYLPSDVEVVFAGNAEADRGFTEDLVKLTQELGVEHRIRFTGYLSETDLESYLVATDLGLCAFKAFSASGSISTWISVACPILAFDLPQIREYNAIESGAIQVFESYTPIALAKAIQDFLEQDQQNRSAQSRKMAKLGQELSLSSTMDRHLALYEAIAQPSQTSSLG